MIGRVPREHAAFAAGIGSLCGNWHVIAATIAEVGLGAFTPEELRAAADEWSDRLEHALTIDDAISATKSGPTA